MIKRNLKTTVMMSMVKITVFVLCVLLNTSFHVCSQEEHIEFQHITVDHGLSNGLIYCICQDRKGFLWFGTDNGLNKYDGYDFKIYWNQRENPNSLSNNTVLSIIEDQYGALWIGTFGGGVNKFDPKTETFTRYQTDTGNPKSINNNFVFSILEDQEGILWIGTWGGGLNKFDPETETFTHYQTVPGDANSLSNNKVRTIYEDRDNAGILWLGTLEGGLNKFSPKTGRFTHYLADPADPHSLSDNSVVTILEDQEQAGILWIGTSGGGLNKFDPKTETFTHFLADPGNPKSLSSNDVSKIYLDRDGMLWVGTSGGLNRFDRKEQEFTRYLADPTDPGSLSANKIRSIYEDRSGVLWIGTEFGGINRFNKEKKKFNHYYHVPDDPNSLSNNMVTAIYEDGSGVLWIGTFDGLNIGERKNETFTFTSYKNIAEDPYSLSNNRILAIYEDRSGEFWIGTLEGLNQLDREKMKFTRYLSDAKNPNSLSHNQILAICEDQWGFLWIGTIDGLNQFNKGNKTFKRYQNAAGDPYSLSHNLTVSIFADSYGVLWVGTIQGLNKFDHETERFTRYLADPGNPNGLSNDVINFIYEDRSGTLWIGTNSGLNKYDRKRDTFSHYSMKIGLPDDVIFGILEDDHGNLWLSTYNGLSKFNPKTRVFNNYDSSDGLQGNEFYYGGYWKSKSGEMLFGGINGFNAFFPDSITDNPSPPSVVITDFKIANKSVPIGEEVDGEIILTKHISTTGEIKLSHKHNILSFDYVGLHYAAPESNRYAYKMEGLDKDWNNVGNRRIAIYSHLTPGHYVFRVKASNNDNLWDETSLRIYISPPFWERWWFLVLLGLTIISMLLGGYYYRTKRLRKRLAEQERVQKLLKHSRDEMKKSRDIAEFRSAENEKLIAAISSIFITVDINGKISQWNDTAEKFFEIPKARVKEQLFVDILKEYIPADKLDEIMEKGLHRDEPSNNIEIQVDLKKDSESKQLLANINPILDKSGKKFGFLFLAEDITPQKKEQMRMLLSQKLEALGQMAAGIAHEIRSPLQYIGDNVRFLLETFGTLMESCVVIKDSVKSAAESGKNIDIERLNQGLQEKDFNFFVEEIPPAMEHIINGVSRVSHIVQSMNEFSHIGREVCEKSDLNEMLKSTLVVAHNRIKKVADLQTDYAPNLPPIYCSMGELNQVFLNLLINAADAIAETGKHGLIKVSTKHKGNELIVEISDNGIGIPDEIKDKIYTPFFTTKKAGHGTGQGLPFSYNIIVERHQGKLYFQSKVNEGTTFFIHLPITEEPEES
ncbi:MAG: PAS domain-containing protein [Candidatus Aminicenantes bacterium]|nr:MAG: PAS domain-containing protein [Candidatus Aminicenantes bacterium]